MVAVTMRSLGFATDCALLQRGGSLIERSEGYWRVTSPHNPTHYWGNFMLLDEPGDVAECEALFHRELPHARHVAIGIDATDLVKDDLRPFSDAGFEVSGGTVLVATALAEVVAPHGVTVRALTTPDDWRQSVVLSMATRDEKYEADGFLVYLRAKSSTQQLLCASGHGAWFGAFVDGALVCQMGLFDCGEGRARFQTVETHPAFRRRGLARATLSALGTYARRALQTEQLVIVADPTYFALDLYRSLGFEVREQQLQIQRLPT